MNLTAMMREGSLVNHGWWQNGMVKPGEVTFDASQLHKNNNTKDDLELSWGMGTIDPSYEEPSAGKVVRNVPTDAQQDAGAVILFARDQMNRGVMGKKLMASLKAKFTKDALMAARPRLAKQLELEGIVGCVAVDGRGYKSCKAAMAVAANSPYKKTIRHVIGCNCGDPHMVPTSKDGGLSKVASSGETFSDFLEDDKNQKEASLVAHCRSAMLPIIAAQSDLDETEMDQTLVNLQASTGLPKSAFASIRKSSISNLGKVRSAFRLINRMAEEADAQPYGEKIDASQFIVDTADHEVELVPEIQGNIEVDGDAGEFEIQAPQSADIDIGFEQKLAGFYANADQVELDEPVTALQDLQVDPKSDMSW